MIPRINKILYATDLSVGASHAFGYAVSIATNINAKISIINVHESPSHNINIKMRSEDFPTAKTKLTNKIKARLLQYSQKEGDEDCTFSNLINEIYITSGNPVEEIIDQAKEGGYDLIVMGTHGHGFLYSALIGSTAKRVITQSEVPVLVVRLPESIA